jgi:hypothetical protein
MDSEGDDLTKAAICGGVKVVFGSEELAKAEPIAPEEEALAEPSG